MQPQWKTYDSTAPGRIQKVAAGITTIDEILQIAAINEES
jgi:hypothetical protein